jgi:hypothetical protein
MDNNKLTLAQADKGHASAILHNDIYIQKVETFLMGNHINTIAKDPMERYHRLIVNTLIF